MIAMVNLSWPDGWANFLDQMLAYTGWLILVATLIAWGAVALDRAEQ